MTERHLTTTYHIDESHGYVTTTLSLLRELGIEKDISQFSYQDGEKVYLEEDCDLARFTKALTANNIIYTFEEKVHYKDCFVRSLPRYRVGA